ncbi:receptor-type tyrosine-protein phosphatase alpha-like [Xenia sp. Carnegie-2017]|uniref:receptor-type tyrosine-protein phosphatase alpha-like n=1 Tax=Xenia sp. Carnegie-2017 TaxID=2897299 RepID=UPI001F039514|nr:receptor-type tyrosine-protein phosphatase alpha-like [Xenia sp. Carnegie-2017]
MVYENNSYVIVMVTSLFERMKMKCSQYWPDKASSKYGCFVVTIIEEKIFANYVVRKLRLSVASKKLGKEDKAREIQQFHFTEWPDHDVPVHPMSLLPFIRHSKLANPPDAGPLVVHCSAGVGRTGVYMVIDSMMERINDDKTVDVFNYLVHIRSQRMSLVQEERQYIFIHDCLLEYIKFGDTSIPIKEFHTRLATLRAVGPGHKKSLLRREFEDIDHTKNLEKHKWAGRKHYNLLKNRRKDILPVERTRVKLPLLLGVDGADYINASYIDGFIKKREFIATQAPMVETAECFYRMVSAVKSSHIVMLLDDEQWKKDDYADLPTEDEPVMCGRFEINLESKEIHEKFTVRKLRLFSSETSDGHIVTHYHYHDWPSGCIPKDKTALINFIEHVRESRTAENSDKPLIVICDYGVGPAGVFCLVSSLYDQIEHEQNVDVFLAAKLFRTQRPKLIETEELYSFCYDVMDQVITRKLISTTTESHSTCRSENISDEKNGSQLPSLNDVAFDMNV